MQLENRLVIVTGGASGLGAAAARAAATSGARVEIWDVQREAGAAVASACGGRFAAVDVTDEQSIARALDAAEAWAGAPRALVHCAGIGGGWKLTGVRGPHPADAFRRVIDVNAFGSFNVARLVADRMRQANPVERGERGVLVLTASIAAFEGQVGQAAYAASKGAVASMTLVFARDLAEYGIRAVAIAPGLFATAMTDGLADPVRDSILASVPFPRVFGSPEDFASLALECCRNAMLNGTVLRLDAAARLPPR
jgi:NAD(P)-dependent dehydrogenase (short-subunit alcohol dehydrogenase family)